MDDVKREVSNEGANRIRVFSASSSRRKFIHSRSLVLRLSYFFVFVGIATVTVTEAVQEKGDAEVLVEVVLEEEEDLEEVEEGIVSRANNQVKD